MIINRFYILNGGKHCACRIWVQNRWCTGMSRELGEAKMASAFSALGQAKVDLSPFSFGSSWLMRLIHADLRTGQLITCWDEDWRAETPLWLHCKQRNYCMYACIRERLQPRFGQCLCRSTQAVIFVVFLHDKVFCQFLLRTPRFILLSLSLLN